MSELALTTTPADLLRLAIDKDLNVAALEKLLDMQFRFEAQQAKKMFDLAMVAFKSEPGLKILKSETVSYKTKDGVAEYRFPPLDRCCEVLVPLLASHLISHRWNVAYKDPLLHVSCVLTHVDGHSEEVTIPGLPDNTGSKNAIQATASTITYLERYTLLAVCGVAACDMPQGERNGDELKPLNPFAELEGEDYRAAFAKLWEEARPAGKQALKQLLAWKHERDEELFL